MSRTIVKRIIDAPVDAVFKTVSDINHFSKAIPRIIKVEIFSDVKSGVGCRFRETRAMKGKQATEELEVTELVENEHVRIVCESHGTLWDSLFTVRPADGKTELILTMDANAHSTMAKMMNPLIKGMVAREIAKDMDAVKSYCEQA